MVDLNSKSDKFYRRIGNIMISITVCSFIVLLVAFIKGIEWVKEQLYLLLNVSEIAFISIIFAMAFYILSSLMLGTRKYVFSNSTINSLNLFKFLFFHYFGVFIQTLAYFALGLPIAYFLIEKNIFVDSDIFLLLMALLSIFFILDTKYIKGSNHIEKWIEKLIFFIQKKAVNTDEFKLEDPEIQLQKVYKLGKIYSIIATITTVLVIGDAANSIVYPLQVPEGSTRFDAYLDSRSSIYMIIFVSTTLVLLKDQVKDGIKI